MDMEFDPNAEVNRLYAIEADRSKKANDQLVTLACQKDKLVEYMKMKIDKEDWHGVADAAMDVRELEASMKILDNYLKGVLH